MTPKEKAKELFSKYYIICQEFTEEIQCSVQAKQCALIGVDEILLKPTPKQKTYWEQVKQQIEKL